MHIERSFCERRCDSKWPFAHETGKLGIQQGQTKMSPFNVLLEGHGLAWPVFPFEAHQIHLLFEARQVPFSSAMTRLGLADCHHVDAGCHSLKVGQVKYLCEHCRCLEVPSGRVGWMGSPWQSLYKPELLAGLAGRYGLCQPEVEHAASYPYVLRGRVRFLLGESRTERYYALSGLRKEGQEARRVLKMTAPDHTRPVLRDPEGYPSPWASDDSLVHHQGRWKLVA